MTCILELNDAGLTLYRDAEVLHRSPGVAVVLEDGVRFGQEALALSRVHPRQTNQQYFSRLNADPLPTPGARARNHADLVYLHLLTFKPSIEAEGGEVLLAVPGVLSADQLGVLLGVLQEVGIRVVGFVDAAVAALSEQALPPVAYHLDVQLQRAVVTTVSADAEVGKTAAREVPECSLVRLLDACINVIADRFVGETRFDPLHAAATEQQLFDQVYRWVEAGADSRELVVEINHADHTRRVELARDALEQKAEQRLQALADALPRDAAVFLSARAARLPGMGRVLDALGGHATLLADDALARGCLTHLGRIVPADGELRLVTRLPYGGVRAEPAPAPAGDLEPPTHALLGDRAWPLAEQLPVRFEGNRPLLECRDGLRLNGAAVEHTSALAPGDRVALDGHEYLLIRVEV